jgi:hypothetical protein
MLRKYAEKRAKELYKKYSSIILSEENAFEIIEKMHEKYNSHKSLDRIIGFLIEFDNLPDLFNYKVAIYYQDKIQERIERLRSEGKHQSTIDITLYEIFCKDYASAKIHYDKMVSKKTKTWSHSKGDQKDSRSLKFHIKKYGEKEGTELYNKKKNDGTFKRTSNACIEYYLERGYSEEEAKELIKERQAVGRLDKFIERYGEEVGKKKWEERQIKWQNTLNSKPQEEIDAIKKKKGFVYSLKAKNIMTNEEISLYVSQTSIRLSKKLIPSIEDFSNRIKEDIKNNIIYEGIHINEIMNHYTPSQFVLLDIEDPILYMKNFIDVIDKYENANIIQNKGLLKNYTMWSEEGFLRSSLEIFTYEKLKERNILFEIDKKYPHDNNPGSWRYDFYLPAYDVYIEVSPAYDKVEHVRKRVDEKEKLFGCLVAKNHKEILDILDSIS